MNKSSSWTPAEVAELKHDGGGDMPAWETKRRRELALEVAAELLVNESDLVTAIYAIPELPTAKIRKIVADSPALERALLDIASRWRRAEAEANSRFEDEMNGPEAA